MSLSVFFDHFDDPPEDDRNWMVIRTYEAFEEFLGYPYDEPDHVALEAYISPNEKAGKEVAELMVDEGYLPETFEVHDYSSENQRQEIEEILSPHADYLETDASRPDWKDFIEKAQDIIENEVKDDGGTGEIDYDTDRGALSIRHTNASVSSYDINSYKYYFDVGDIEMEDSHLYLHVNSFTIQE